MTDKPKSLTRASILAFGLALVAAGLFTPIYQTAESVWGKEEAANIFNWILAAKDAQENSPDSPPAVDIQDEKPTDNESLLVDAIDITRITQHGRNKVDYGRMTVHNLLKSAKVQGSNVRYNNDLPASWWASDSDHMKFARMHIVWADGGGYYGGHFDWCKKGQTVKTLSNTKNGYMGKNASGTMYLFMVSNDGKHRTNILKVE